MRKASQAVLAPLRANASVGSFPLTKSRIGVNFAIAVHKESNSFVSVYAPVLFIAIVPHSIIAVFGIPTIANYQKRVNTAKIGLFTRYIAILQQ
jgi:hypothetical protein